MLSRRKTLASIVILFLVFAAAIVVAAKAGADTPMIECPNHSHVWNRQDCPPDSGPFGFPGTGHGGAGQGGLLGLVHNLTGGLL